MSISIIVLSYFIIQIKDLIAFGSIAIGLRLKL